MNQRELFLRHVAQTSGLPLLGVDVNIQNAKGVHLYDEEGNEYLDLISGISVSNIGHCHPEVVKAIRDQSEKFMHLMVYGEFNQKPQVQYAERLCALLPGKLNSIFFTTGGSEAVEGAMKLAKRATGRTEIISFKNAYHGSTQGALSIMGSEFFKNSFRPLLPDVKQITFNNAANLAEITERTAAVFVEFIQGEAGVIKGDPEFIRALKQKCDETGALLVADEIQTGFGRTGTLFAFEQYSIVPDILLVAKGMGGGLPIGAFIASGDLMKELISNPVLGHINTFGGNAVCVSAAEAALKVISESKLWENARTIESLVKQKLRDSGANLRICGALGALDLGNEEQNFRLIRSCLDRKIITDWFLFCSTAMRISPPLIIKDFELTAALNYICNTIESLDQKNETRI